MKYQEEQSFNQPWLIVLLLLIMLIPVVGIIYQVELGKQFGTNPVSDVGLFIMLIAFSLPLLLLRFIKLDTRIDPHGIYYRFSPFSGKKLTWEEIETAEVLDYGFIGGWGIRLPTKYGTAYNVRGRKGLALILKNGKKILIGTQNPEKLRAHLVRMDIPQFKK